MSGQNSIRSSRGDSVGLWLQLRVVAQEWTRNREIRPNSTQTSEIPNSRISFFSRVNLGRMKFWWCPVVFSSANITSQDQWQMVKWVLPSSLSETDQSTSKNASNVWSVDPLISSLNVSIDVTECFNGMFQLAQDKSKCWNIFFLFTTNVRGPFEF